MHTSVLRQGFPVDQETNNFVRQVHNQMFNLLYILFRLDIILPFSPISSEVVTEILNLKTTARDGMDSFLRILAEIWSCQTLLYCPTDTADIRQVSKKGNKYFFYGVLHEQKVYSQKFLIASYKKHSSALWEYVRIEEDKRQNGQNWCATLFPVAALSQFLIEHCPRCPRCGRGCRVRGH